MSHKDNEDAIESPLMDQLAGLGYETLDAMSEFNQGVFSGHITGREAMQQVVLVPRLASALRRLNPQLPPEAITQAAEQLTENRRLQSFAVANAGVYHLLKNGVEVSYRDDNGEEVPGRMAVFDWSDPHANDLLEEYGVDLDAIIAADGYQRIALKQDAVEALLASDDVTDHFMTLVRDVTRLYRSILPDKAATEFYITQRILNIIKDAILSEVPDADISGVIGQVSDLLDESVVTERYVIEASPTDTTRRYDLSQIDFDALREQFERGHKRTATEKLRGSVQRRLRRMVQENRTRLNYMEAFQQMLDAYNNGAVNVSVMFERLLQFVEDLNAEEQRAVQENLSEEELAIFDLLTKPAPDLTAKEREQVKAAAKDLLATLNDEKLVLDWRKHQQSQASVRHSIELVLDDGLPTKYDGNLYEDKCHQVYQHVFEAYAGNGQSVYDLAG
jgi:type I restriction enzyme, R subunit